MKKLVCVLMLCLALPVIGLAVTEGVVEEAAAVDVAVTVQADTVSYLPDESYYAGEAGYEPAWGASETHVEPEWQGDCFGPSAQWPGLTSGEIIRAKKLLAAYQSGEAKGDGASVLNATDNAVLGVYPLNPADYDGETVFVILPNISLTDEQMLAMIDAFHQLGQTFNPEGLNYRNCMRGGGIECTRFFSEEEQERRKTLHNLIRSGKLKDVAARNDLNITLDARYFNGLDGFSFRPYRRMTDEELAGHLVAMGVHDESAETDFVGIEKQTRDMLIKAFSCPISMELENIGTDGGYTPKTFDDNGEAHYAASGRVMSFAYYRYPKTGYEYVSAAVDFDQETGRMIGMSLTDIPLGWEQTETDRDPAVPDEAYFAVAEAFVCERMHAYIADADTLEWHMDDQDVWWINYGPSVRVCARIPQTNEMLSIHVGCGDMQVHMVHLEADQRGWFEDVDFESAADYPVNG